MDIDVTKSSEVALFIYDSRRNGFLRNAFIRYILYFDCFQMRAKKQLSMLRKLATIPRGKWATGRIRKQATAQRRSCWGRKMLVSRVTSHNYPDLMVSSNRGILCKAMLCVLWTKWAIKTAFWNESFYLCCDMVGRTFKIAHFMPYFLLTSDTMC